MKPQLNVIVKQHNDAYVSYALGLGGVVIGQGDTYEDAFKDTTSAIQFHIETFGPDALGEVSTGSVA